MDVSSALNQCALHPPFNKRPGAAVLNLTSDSKIDVDRLRTEIRQDFTELELWSSVLSNLKKILAEEQTIPGRDIE